MLFLMYPALFFSLFGLAFGSFGNVLIYRIPEGRSIGGRSRCPGCRKTLCLRELIPVLSYLFLRGRCARCRMKISPQYPLVELASAALFVAAFLHAQTIPRAIILALILWLLLLIAVSDARTSLIPDAFNFPLIGLSLVYALITRTSPVTGVVTALAFLGGQWSLSRGQWIGSGDILLGIGMGLLLGAWERVLVAMFAAYILGALIAVVLLLIRKKTMKDALPFGPFLVLGTMIALFWGREILRLYIPV